MTTDARSQQTMTQRCPRCQSILFKLRLDGERHLSGTTVVEIRCPRCKDYTQVAVC